MKTVRIYGMASNLVFAPPVPPGVEVWCCNNPKRDYNKHRPAALQEWTRWFNLHSRRHMTTTYPRGYAWYGEQTQPIVLQDVQPDIPASVKFPRDEIMAHFGTRYFTFSASWFMALAVMEGFERIELYGFMLRDKPTRPHECYKFERPCFFYWVQRAREAGVEVSYPPELDLNGDNTPGDPTTYDGPLYGYETT